MFTNKKSLLALSVASAFALTGCFSDDDGNDYTPPGPGPDPVVVVPPQTPTELNFIVNVSVVNSDSDAIADATVRFVENGAPSTNIVDVDGNAVQTATTTEDGGFIVTVKSGSELSSVTAVVSAAGFITKSFKVDLSNEDELSVLPAQFQLTSSDAAGLASDVKVSTDISGSTTTAPIIADALVSGDSGDSLATATLPTGITLQNAAGEAVTGDSVSLSVVGTDPTSSTKSSVIPEGLNADNTSANVLVPVSVADVNLLVGDTKVKKFAGDTLKVTLAAPTDLAAGETLTVKSFDDETGQWSADDFAVTQGTGTVSFETNHLTWFAVNRNANTCTDGFSVNVASGTIPAGGLFVVADSSDMSVFNFIRGGATSKTVVPAALTTGLGVYDGATARVRLFDREGGTWFDSQTEVGVCGAVAVTPVAPFTLVNKELTLTGACSNDADVAVNVTNSTVSFKRAGKAARAAIKDANGNFQLTNLREGENYDVTVNFRGLPVEGANTFTIEGANADALTQAFQFTCPTSTGGTGGTGGNG
ncbi:hypothetical protein H5183_21305 [Pseudoalteromonas sp. SR44-8]|uniref:hypothetical protein n=1 Tax=Pseudoalteromonas sp. SR44-8 TaxID=2760933 RepID=UPI0016028E6E|nr:hypothetical protein [Pseudoalteromonas sp. SR44-8]MBB1303837.1 hypothetical protein [Pseudoalteromonas sp. SR44-8]